MNSPITGKKMKLIRESRSLSFRKESFDIIYHHYLCEGSGESFTTTELDELNMVQLYNQYREKHNLPFPEEIKAIREKYGLAASKMSEILGFGINSYRNYENGEVPTQANARLIQLADDPQKFRDLVLLTEVLNARLREKLLKRIDILIEKYNENHFSLEFQDYLLGEDTCDEYSGYRKPNLEKLSGMVSYFSENQRPYKTKLNKLLFYADFLHFKNNGFSISGARYKAIDMGPVPNNFNSIFEYLANKGQVNIITQQFPGGGEGEQFVPAKDFSLSADLFNQTEWGVLKQVSSIFRKTSTSKIIAKSHEEAAWKNNYDQKKTISYKQYAFDLSVESECS